MRYGIIGAGAIGAYFGAKLVKAGEEVHFLFHSDYDVVCSRGLQINSVAGDFHLEHVNAYHRAEDMPVCDVVIVALKSTQQHLLPTLLSPLLGQDTLVMLIQNGIGLEADFAERFLGVGVVAGMAFIASTKTQPGVVDHQELGRIDVGNYNCKDQERLDAMIADFNRAGVPVQEKAYAKARWKKAIWNMCFNGLTVALNTTVDQLLACESTAKICQELMLEVVHAARACGVTDLTDDYADRMLTITRGMKPYSPSMKVDFDHHRAMEIEYIYTRPIREASLHGYDMRMMRMLEAQLRFISQRRSCHN
jgi:2-dehydropantoate 2-reductase